MTNEIPNTIRVRVNESSKKVTVRIKLNSNLEPITIYANDPRYWYNLSKDWATLLGSRVQNLDYSSKQWATYSKIWAEGTDEEVETLGGEHSAKQWSLIVEERLSNQIEIHNADQAAHQYIQNLIADETTLRQQADTTLQGNIDNEETARKAADTTLQGNINAEALARQQADLALSEEITSSISTHNSSNSAHSDIRQGVSTNAEAISSIESKIPAQASSSNQLADKSFVNSSIATNTAYFVGTFNSLEELEAYSEPLTNNDYAFVVGEDEDGNTVYDRYKYTTATISPSWQFEYELNNSSFTATQWAAINSGITSGGVTLIGTALQPNDDITNLNNNAGYISGIDSTDVTNALGYTPYDASNPNGYTSNVGTVTSVNHVNPDNSGNVALAIKNYTSGTGISLSNDIVSINQTAVSTTVNNFNINGSSLTINDGVISNFSLSSFIVLPSAFSPNDSTWEIVMKFTTGSDLSVNQGVFGGLGNANSVAPLYFVENKLITYLSSNGTSWDITQGHGQLLTLTTNTTYKIKEEFTGTQYIWSLYENGGWTVIKTINTSTKVYGGLVMQIGTNRGANGPFLGSVDLNDWYIKVDGQYWWQPYITTGGSVAKATNELYGLVKPDNSTITVNNGVISFNNSAGYATEQYVNNIVGNIETLLNNINSGE